MPRVIIMATVGLAYLRDSHSKIQLTLHRKYSPNLHKVKLEFCRAPGASRCIHANLLSPHAILEVQITTTLFCTVCFIVISFAGGVVHSLRLLVVVFSLGNMECTYVCKRNVVFSKSVKYFCCYRVILCKN